MGGEWILVRCKCGHSFGSQNFQSAYCNRCNSNQKLSINAKFETNSDLALAVSAANLPKGLHKEFSKKLKIERQKNIKSKSNSDSGGEMMLRIMKNSLDDNGNLSLESVKNSMLIEGIDNTTVEQIIGQAEMQGLLIRVDSNTWNWLG
ncbi:MAG: hypothetical protein HN534_05330 [Euryarchaeota archaeon]|mgnify:CR=1 FL=1|jgi:hypothetical protein|nr:hypothetical protein [Euryarchaeota archaeon]MBT3757460.1 hypothetical protein [Euryarchaeota archaeon]MBT4050552.1 hypothetical protein [Euryarchaeota archaeon]MBT4650685.1 hypothetical protein [Euryarchaeota archaeon]MBT4961646.1 hypothetical protein [Euryarchaeota archaeon]|tara:strand:+ start:11904 stop:12347 length:444 start_codon:yes stop_codon:yes gene_type:complete